MLLKNQQISKKIINGIALNQEDIAYLYLSLDKVAERMVDENILELKKDFFKKDLTY